MRSKQSEAQESTSKISMKVRDRTFEQRHTLQRTRKKKVVGKLWPNHDDSAGDRSDTGGATSDVGRSVFKSRSHAPQGLPGPSCGPTVAGATEGRGPTVATPGNFHQLESSGLRGALGDCQGETSREDGTVKCVSALDVPRDSSFHKSSDTTLPGHMGLLSVTCGGS